MILAITAVNDAPDASFDPHFGRASYFCIVDLENESSEIVPNPAVTASSGAGIRAAQLMSERSVEAVISGSFGPKAFRALDAAGVAMYAISNADSLTINDALAQFRSGQMQPLTAPSHAGGAH